MRRSSAFQLSICVLLAGCAAGEISDDATDQAGEGGKADSAASAGAPLGATPHTGGTMFRVWAPNADTVAVQGDFNAWSETASPLARETGSVWSADVAGAKPGDEYLYVIRHGAQTLYKQDPRSRDVTNSSGNSVIYDRNAYQWQTT